MGTLIHLHQKKMSGSVLVYPRPCHIDWFDKYTYIFIFKWARAHLTLYLSFDKFNENVHVVNHMGWIVLNVIF